MTADRDRHYMARAIALAARGLYTAKPNPRVGCVLVKHDNIIAQGWHQRTGGPHAEIVALQQAGAAAEGATAYVSLEPCAHHGRTPPCAEALIKARVKRVVAAMLDPNPLVAGKGMQQLKQAGIAVEHGVGEQAAALLNPGFIKRMQRQLPLLRCKVAMSLDGRTAMASGESQWITGAAARADVQHWRARSAAIVTGIGTLLADNPSLNVRAHETHANTDASADDSGDTARGEHISTFIDGYAYPQRPLVDFQDQDQPVRVVLDSRLRTPVGAKLLQLPGRALIYTLNNDQKKITQLEDQGAEVCLLSSNTPKLDLNQVLTDLANREVNEVLLEAGARLNGAMVSAGLVDEFIFYIAPSIMGDQALGAFHLPQITTMAQKRQLTVLDTRQIGVDWRIIGQ